MSKYYYVGCCKCNYAAYVKKNMPHNIHYQLFYISYIPLICYQSRISYKFTLTLSKLCGIINLP